MKYSNSKSLFERALQSIPGGVNSPVRAFKSVGGSPIFIKKARGAYLYDEDENKYIDFVNSWGPAILGHAPDLVLEGISKVMYNGTSFGASTELEIHIAELIKKMVPNIDLIRMVNSGTEACMSAIRLARGYTGKNKFIKFDGCYHGHADSFLVKAGSGVATFNIQNIPGVTEGVAADTLICTYNDLNSVIQLIDENKNEIAAIILEPVAGNMGCIPPEKEFLKGLRTIADQENILLIFDEVMTGFRLAKGGAQEYYNIYADLITFGKVIGGGLPVGAFGGKYEIMKQIAPLGNVYQAGTLSGNPLAMAAGLSLLTELNDHPNIYDELEQKSLYLEKGLRQIFADRNLPHAINRVGSMISVFFGEGPFINFESVSQSDISLFNRFFHAMLNKGVYLPPSAFETWFISNALTTADLDKTISAAGESLEEILK